MRKKLCVLKIARKAIKKRLAALAANIHLIAIFETQSFYIAKHHDISTIL
jgi:hypothetical protein